MAGMKKTPLKVRNRMIFFTWVLLSLDAFPYLRFSYWVGFKMDGVEVVVMDFKMVHKMGDVPIYYSLFL